MSSSYPIDIENHIQDEDPVILNIGGVKYEVMPSTLAQYPETLLGHIFHPNNRHLRKPDKKGEYFFDRNGRLFEVIINFYRTGKLVIPSDVPEEIIREEIKYFRIDYKGSSGNGSNGGNKEEDEDEKIMKLPKDQLYQYAQGLIHSASRKDIKRGLKFLCRLRETEPNSYLYRYSYSFACYRLGENAKGIESLEEILSTDQHNPQAKSLLTLFNDVRVNNTRNGIVAFCLIAVGIYGFFKIKKWYQIAQLVNSNTIINGIPSSSSSSGTVTNAIGNVAKNLTTSAAPIITTVSSSVPLTTTAVVPETVYSQIISPVVNSISNIADEITDTASNVATSTVTPSIALASINSLSQSNVQSIPFELFNNSLSNTFPKN